jgi:hypothetical protein
MMPRWQMAAMFIAVAALIVGAFYQTPRGQAYFSGQCWDRVRPAVCDLASRVASP